MEMKTATLKEDIFSTFKPACQYGKKGENVFIVSFHGKTVIVQNKLGNKYPVNHEKLIYEKM